MGCRRDFCEKFFLRLFDLAINVDCDVCCCCREFGRRSYIVVHFEDAHIISTSHTLYLS